MSSINHNTTSLLDLSVSISDDTSCYSEDSQPRICFDGYCIFPLGDMCEACKLDRQIRKKMVSRNERVQIAEWVEEINVQKYITNYSGQEFVGGADERDAIENDDGEDREVEAEGGEGYDGDDDCSSDETEIPNHSDEEDRPDFSGIIPVSFACEWTAHTNRSSTLEERSPSTGAASILNQQLGGQMRDARLESWICDIFDRTLDGQMEDTIFIGGAEDDSGQVRCPLCGNPVGDARDQHLIQCQFAHDEQERMEASLKRVGNGR